MRLSKLNKMLLCGLLLAAIQSCDFYREQVVRTRNEPCLLGGEHCQQDSDCCDRDCLGNRCMRREP